MFAMGLDDHISRKGEKNVFSPEDKNVTWSAYVGGLGQHNSNSYTVCWFGPNGHMIAKSKPENIGFDSSNLKAMIPLEGRALGIYKVEVIYRKSLIEEKYFKYSEDENDVITDKEIKTFEAKLDRPVLVYSGVEKDTTGRGVKDEGKKVSLSYVFSRKVNKKEKNKVASFPLNEEKIIYRCNFKGTFPVNDCVVRWYTPDGQKLIGKDSKNPLIFDPTLKSTLNLSGVPEERRKGLWVVTCTKGGEAVDSVYFLMGDADPLKVTVAQVDNLNKLIQEQRFVSTHEERAEYASLGEDERTSSRKIKPSSERKNAYKGRKELSDKHLELEDELILESDKIDELIYSKGILYEDEKLTGYLTEVAKRIKLNEDISNDMDIKVRVIRDPLVNAFATPNGSIYVHTGALSHIKNEAQLSFLLAHEMSHVVNKDSVFHVKDKRGKTVAYKLFDLVLSPAAVFFGVFGDLAQVSFNLLYASSVTGYRRDIEARADKDAIRWVSNQGYHPKEAGDMIKIFLSEKSKYQSGPEVYFLMNHPSNEWRLKQIRKIVDNEYGGGSSGDINKEKFLNNMRRVKLYNAELNIKMERLEHARESIDWVLREFPHDPEAHYLIAEVYRLKAEDKTRLKYEISTRRWRDLIKGREEGELEEYWEEEAEKHYNAAIEYDETFASSYKGLGHLYQKSGNNGKARKYFSKYLEIEPGAKDKRHIKYLIKKLAKLRNVQAEKGETL